MNERELFKPVDPRYGGDGTVYDPLFEVTDDEATFFNEQIYSPRELDRLRAFAHIQDMVHEVETNLDEGNNTTIYWEKDNEPATKTTVLIVTPAVLGIMRHMAFGLYTEFRGSEKMKEVADSILQEHQEDKMVEEKEKREQFNSWWDYS